MRGLINRITKGWKRTRVPQNVWDAYQEAAVTQVDGRTNKERLATMPTETIVDFMREYFRGQGSTLVFLTYLREDLNNNRGEVSLL